MATNERLKAGLPQVAATNEGIAVLETHEEARAISTFAGATESYASTHSSVADRQIAMDMARASVALEGLKGSAEGEAIQQRWVRGEITMDECIAAIKARYKKAISPP